MCINVDPGLSDILNPGDGTRSGARSLAWAFEPGLRGTYCSMAPDLPKGITEIDYYNQRLVDLAGDRPCPLNRAAVRVIKRMERERTVPNPRVLEELTLVL